MKGVRCYIFLEEKAMGLRAMCVRGRKRVLECFYWFYYLDVILVFARVDFQDFDDGTTQCWASCVGSIQF